jgi:hypothetical protein
MKIRTVYLILLCLISIIPYSASFANSGDFGFITLDMTSTGEVTVKKLDEVKLYPMTKIDGGTLTGWDATAVG